MSESERERERERGNERQRESERETEREREGGQKAFWVLSDDPRCLNPKLTLNPRNP